MDKQNTNPSFFQEFFADLRRRRAMKIFMSILRRTLLLLILLLFALYIILQLKPVQNWLVQKAAKQLSENIHTEVAIKEIDFRFFDNLVLSDFYVADLNQDTLLYAKEFRTSMSANLLALINGRFDFDEIDLVDAQVNLNILPFETENNLQKVLANITLKERKNKKPIYLDLQTLRLKNVKIQNTNQARGFYQFFTVPNGVVNINSLDVNNMNFDVSSIEINNPIVQLELHPGKDSTVYVEETESEEPVLIDSLAIPQLKLTSFQLNKGQFTFHNYRKSETKITPDSIIDYQHLFITDIDLELGALTTDFEHYETELVAMALKESSGFKLSNFTSKEVIVDNRAAKFHGAKLTTPYSTLGDTLIFKYRKFTDIDYFNERVLMDGRIKNSKVALRDIMSFAPGLKSNQFFTKNKNERIDLSGRFLGRVDNLKGRDIKLRFHEGTVLEGNFNSRNLTQKQEEVVNLQLDRLVTDMKTLRQLIPDFNPPPNFDKLGNLDFNGRFDGFFLDFVAYGALNTDLGSAEVDMKMDLSEGRQNARYSGKLSLDQFDLGTWSDNKDLGFVSLESEVAEGFGFTLDQVDTDLTAKIAQFDFRDYTYENVDMTGKLNKNLFDGDLVIHDDNIDLNFSGAIQFGDSIPEFDFAAKVNKLDLQAVNLTKKPIEFRGEIDLNLIDRDIAKIRGTAIGSNLVMIEAGLDTFVLDSVNLKTALLPGGNRTLSLYSEILNAEINGAYVLNEIPEAFLQYFERNFEQFANRLNIKSNRPDPINTNFTYDIRVPDSKNFLKLIDPKIGRVQKAEFTGSFDTRSDVIVSNIDLPSIEYDNIKLDEIFISVDGDEVGNNIYLEINHSRINNFNLEPITLRGDLQQNELAFHFNALSWTSILDNLQLKGIFTVNEDFFKLQFLPTDLAILREKWRIGEDNYIQFDKDYLDIYNVLLTNEDRSIELQSIDHKGLTADLKNFDFAMIDEYWDYDKLDFNGNFHVNLTAEEIFNLNGLSLNVSSDTLFVNGEDWGVFRLDAQTNSVKDNVYTYFSITKTDGQLTGEGYIIPPGNQLSKTARKVVTNSRLPSLDFDLNVSRYPLHIAEYWLGNGISNTTGLFDLGLDITGVLNKPNVSGEIRVYEGAMDIDFLKTRYYIEDEKAIVNNFLFDVSGSIIRDSLGNEATLTGGITHDHLRNLGLDVSMLSGNFAALNTTKKDNKIFYGKAMANGLVSFTGSFRQPNIIIDASPMPGTNIVIPISSEQEASEVNFITFINKEDSLNINGEADELLGVSMDMRLSLNDNALMELVFDEKTGDVIQGRGDGDVRLVLDRNGNFTMNGNYFVNTGNYLFTALDVFNKPFQFKEGGIIRWSGDPYNADIDLEAEYRGLNASVVGFIDELLIDQEGSNLRNQASQATKVDLSMNLQGQLLNPEISFNLEFPELTGELRSYVESKLLSIRQDPNELNRQVFGLMVFGTFLPRNTGNNTAGSTTDIFDFGINTVSEFLSSQLSLFFTDLLAGSISDGKFLTGFQFDVDYNRYEDITSGSVLTNNQFGVRPKFFFFDDRLTVDFGGDVNVATASGTAYFGGDVVAEYAISNDRRLKVKVYQLYDRSIFGGLSQRGVGLSYRREGDTFKELFARNRKKKAKKVDAPEPVLQPTIRE